MITPDMSAHSFLRGAPAYGAGTGWKIFLAVPTALAIYVIAEVAAGLLFGVLGGQPADLVPPPAAPGTAASPFTSGVLLILFIAQAGIVLATLGVTGIWGQGAHRILRLDPPEGGLRAYLWSIALLVVVTGLLNGLIWIFFPSNFLSDFKVFHSLTHGDRPWLVMLAICLGAPLSEEILFRGFLLSSATASTVRDAIKLLIGAAILVFSAGAAWMVGRAAPQWAGAAMVIGIAAPVILLAIWALRPARAPSPQAVASGTGMSRPISFWPAAVVVTFAWTLLHVQYTVTGMVEVFVIGILLSWMLWRTGSLRVPLLCHALYNSTLFLILRLVPVAA